MVAASYFVNFLLANMFKMFQNGDNKEVTDGADDFLLCFRFDPHKKMQQRLLRMYNATIDKRFIQGAVHK